MILKLSKKKKLSFYRKTDIFIGEKDFDKIQVLIPSEVDENDTSELTFKLHLVNERGEYAIRTLTVEQEGIKVVGSTSITADLTSVAQDFSVYIEMVKGNDTIIGKTNVLEVRVNPLPDEQGEIIPEDIERQRVIVSSTNPPSEAHKKYLLNAFWVNYADKTQFVLTSIDESQAPEKYAYTWKRNNNHVVVSTETAPEYTPDNVDYKYSNGDMWVQTDLDSDKILSISICTGYTKELIDNETWRYNYTWAILNSGITNYNELNNKPQINNITLQGNKSSDDLNLQDKLTAGENITISSDNVISAEGGVTSYEDLTNKPQINNIALEGNKSASDLGLQRIIGNYFTVENNEYLGYDFNSISLLGSNSIMYCVPFSMVRNFPNSLSDKILQSGRLYIFHYVHTTVGAKYLIRRIMGQSPSGNYAEFAQYCTVIDDSSSVIGQSDWVELTGSGSQIVSGVVNANGTITFTDSDGNTFTTTGSSVIGADGFSPVATVTQTASGATVSITDSTGTTTANIANGQDGNDYVLTTQDKSDIADIVLSELPTTQGVLYGNTSN